MYLHMYVKYSSVLVSKFYFFRFCYSYLVCLFCKTLLLRVTTKRRRNDFSQWRNNITTSKYIRHLKSDLKYIHENKIQDILLK